MCQGAHVPLHRQHCYTDLPPIYETNSVLFFPFPSFLFSFLLCNAAHSQPAVTMPFALPLFSISSAAEHSPECGLAASTLSATHCTLCCSFASSLTLLASGAVAPSPDGPKNAVKLSKFCCVGMNGRNSSVVNTLQSSSITSQGSIFKISLISGLATIPHAIAISN